MLQVKADDKKSDNKVKYAQEQTNLGSPLLTKLEIYCCRLGFEFIYSVQFLHHLLHPFNHNHPHLYS